MWEAFLKSRLALLGGLFLFCLFLIGLYAPLLASSVPLIVIYQGKIYFPLFKYLLFRGFYTKEIDLFFNALMLTFPLFLLLILFRKRMGAWFLRSIIFVSILQIALFSASLTHLIRDPISNLKLKQIKEEEISKKRSYDARFGEFAYLPSFEFEERYFSQYERIRELYRYKLQEKKRDKLFRFCSLYEEKYQKLAPTLFSLRKEQEREMKDSLNKRIKEMEGAVLDAKEKLAPLHKVSLAFLNDEEKSALEIIKEDRKLHHELSFIEDRSKWLEKESQKLFAIYPLLRPFHWEEDAGGSELFNRMLPFFEVTRPNRKDLFSSLIFGIRISIVVGVASSILALAIGIPFGLSTGYFGGKVDLFLFRLIEVNESMPSFFMLLLIIAITHVKSIFLVIFALAFFGWTSFARYVRAETLRERSKSYVLASQSMGFSSSKILFSEILPNAIFPILALLPFSMMSAISAEAALSFLGLGEENSASLGVLMSEARAYFPGESYLLWPPAIIISLLLISFALMGDGLRKSLDPRSY